MKKVIHQIRKQPSHHRDRIVWIVAAVTAGLLMLIWGVVGNGRPTTPDENFFNEFNQDLENSKNTFEDINLEP